MMIETSLFAVTFMRLFKKSLRLNSLKISPFRFGRSIWSFDLMPKMPDAR